jgi:hypothetical protein
VFSGWSGGRLAVRADNTPQRDVLTLPVSALEWDVVSLLAPISALA